MGSVISRLEKLESKARERSGVDARKYCTKHNTIPVILVHASAEVELMDGQIIKERLQQYDFCRICNKPTLPLDMREAHVVKVDFVDGDGNKCYPAEKERR